MHVVFPGELRPAKFSMDPDVRLTDDEYYNLCIANPDMRLERTAEGEIIIVPPAGAESDHRNAHVVRQLINWELRDGRGKAFGSSAAFLLPTGAAFSPDAAWVSNTRLSKLSKNELRKFPALTPEFVIEVLSPSDRRKSAKEKMQEWLRAGVDLAWLIDADEKCVYVYRAGQIEPEKCENITAIAGEGPVQGFELDLTEIWRGL
jgi:Uma2 family endonuclease